ncbi:MAG: hypothetical protein ACLUB2_03720 [Butyricicoccus pullicaecorum]
MADGESGGDMEEETQYADAAADRAVNAMEAIMQTHPEGVAIICAHNDDMATTARAAASNPAMGIPSSWASMATSRLVNPF